MTAVRQAYSEPVQPAPPTGEQKRFLSLANRLAVIIFALVAGVSLLVAFELARRERKHFIESKSNAAKMLTELFAASVAPALDFADTEAIGSSLSALLQNREVVDAAIWSLQGQAPLARLAREGNNAALPERRAPGTYVTDNAIDISRAITSPTGKQLGAVAVRVSLARENAAFAGARRRIFWLAFGMAALISGLLIAMLRKTIVSPLARLERAARGLARGELNEVTDLPRDEIGSLGRTFNQMGHAIREREDRVRAVNASLQGLLDNMRQAIMVFDANGSVGPERSRIVRDVFGKHASGSIVDLLYPEDHASAVEREAFGVWLSVASSATELEFDAVLELAPKEVALHREGADDRLLELEFRRAASEAGCQRFMLLATDVTVQRQLQRTAEVQERDHQKQLTAMRRVLIGGGQVFVRFLSSTRERLLRAASQVAHTGRLEAEVVEHVFRFVHTLRAEARSFDLKRVEGLAVELELELSGARHAPADSAVREAAQRKLRDGLAALSLELERAEELFVQSSPIGRRVLEQLTVSRQDVDELFRRFGQHPGELGKLATRLAARPFGELLSTLPESVARWSSKENKAVELVVTGREALVPALLSERLPAVLMHLLRNAVAHGIELTAQRRLQEKPDFGRIELSCRETEAGVVIEVTDDGAGLDVEALKREPGAVGAVGRGLELAFVAGLSTRGTPDELAGHGVGLSAVRDELDQVGYAVSVISHSGKGARFVIERAPQPAEVSHV